MSSVAAAPKATPPDERGAPRGCLEGRGAGQRRICATSSIPRKWRKLRRSPRVLLAICARDSCAASEIRRRGRRLDLRRTIHRSISHGGTPIDLAWRRRKTKPLRLVVLLDASGSMNLYTAFFVRFLHGVVDAFREAEAFVFHTRLVHVSASMRDRDVARAVERALVDGARDRRRYAQSARASRPSIAGTRVA